MQLNFWVEPMMRPILSDRLQVRYPAFVCCATEADVESSASARAVKPSLDMNPPYVRSSRIDAAPEAFMSIHRAASNVNSHAN